MFSHLNKNRYSFLIILFFFLIPGILACGCGKENIAGPPAPLPVAPLLKPMNYCIQVGAFLNLDHAIGLMEKLNARGMDAYYFKHATGLYKVRFGNYPTDTAAREAAAGLQVKGIIGEYFIIKPDEYAAAQAAGQGSDFLREQIVKTAESFIGMPYRWGGTSKQGFDCSGLTMTVYRLNGLDLDRVSIRQYEKGRPISKEQLQAGDLVFFSPEKTKSISHVGIFIGNDQFIHAPSSGKRVKTDSLSQKYYTMHYIGARTYF